MQFVQTRQVLQQALSGIRLEIGEAQDGMSVSVNVKMRMDGHCTQRLLAE